MSIDNGTPICGNPHVSRTSQRLQKAEQVVMLHFISLNPAYKFLEAHYTIDWGCDEENCRAKLFTSMYDPTYKCPGTLKYARFSIPRHLNPPGSPLNICIRWL